VAWLRITALAIASQLLRHALRAFGPVSTGHFHDIFFVVVFPVLETKHLPQPMGRFGFGTRKQVAICVHCQRDRGMPHDGLDRFGVRAG
jgi:hypothetical protein